MNIHDLKQRKCDPQGCGHYGASRGSRKHNGVDLTASPGDKVSLDFSGEVVKVGFAYSDPKKSHLRYVAVKLDKAINGVLTGIYSDKQFYCRVFYISTDLENGDTVMPGTTIGEVKDLTVFYKGITNHIHFELYTTRKGIHDRSGFDYVDPNKFIEYLQYRGRRLAGPNN